MEKTNTEKPYTEMQIDRSSDQEAYTGAERLGQPQERVKIATQNKWTTIANNPKIIFLAFFAS